MGIRAPRSINAAALHQIAAISTSKKPQLICRCIPMSQYCAEEKSNLQIMLHNGKSNKADRKH